MNDEQEGDANDRVQPLYVTLILDETGSMQSCKGAAIAGFNQYIDTLRTAPAETRVTLTLFNSSKTEIRYRGVPASPSTIWIWKPIAPTTSRRSTMPSDAR